MRICKNQSYIITLDVRHCPDVLSKVIFNETDSNQRNPRRDPFSLLCYKQPRRPNQIVLMKAMRHGTQCLQVIVFWTSSHLAKIKSDYHVKNKLAHSDMAHVSHSIVLASCCRSGVRGWHLRRSCVASLCWQSESLTWSSTQLLIRCHR